MKSSIAEADKKYYLPVFNRYPVTLKKAKGSLVWDINGKKYIDVLAGIAVNSLGHTHPEVVKAIKKQSKKLIHISNFYTSKPQVQLAKELVGRSGLQRVFFSNSGAEANETAYKLVRKYGHKNGKGGKIIALENCFHGRTLANIATGKSKHKEGFEPIPDGFEKIPFNQIDAVRKTIDGDTAAVIVELIQGEGGINIADKSYIKELRKICDHENVLLIFDEIQTGMGRTGKFFAHEHYDIKPDVLTMAKALGSGFPIGATLCNQKVAGAISLGDHGTTFGGNPLACAASLATLKVIDEEKLVKRSSTLGKEVIEYIKKKAKDYPAVKDIRGLGLMIGIEISVPGRKVVEKMMEQGILGNVTADHVIRFVPPLSIKKSMLYQAVDVFFDSLEESGKH